MTIWIAGLLICWLEAGALDCYIWTGGAWDSLPACVREVDATVARSGAAYYQAVCTRTVTT